MEEMNLFYTLGGINMMIVRILKAVAIVIAYFYLDYLAREEEKDKKEKNFGGLN